MTPDGEDAPAGGETPGALRRVGKPRRATPLPKPLGTMSADEVFGWVKQNGW